jgi:hypothetical protein
MSIRKCALILSVACASVLVVPVAASAAATPKSEAVSSFAAVPVQGKTATGTAFKGHFTVTHFTAQNGVTYAVGRLTAHIGQRAGTKSGVAIPISVQHPSTSSASTAASCPILHLVLGPLNLNLLGLHVTLNQVVLNITAISGPGNLLGNLLCGVSNLLNGSTAVTPSQLGGLLGVVSQLLTTPGLLNL